MKFENYFDDLAKARIWNLMDSSDAVIPSSSQVNLSDEKLSLNPACQIALEKNDLEFFTKM